MQIFSAEKQTFSTFLHFFLIYHCFVSAVPHLTIRFRYITQQQNGGILWQFPCKSMEYFQGFSAGNAGNDTKFFRSSRDTFDFGTQHIIP